MNTNCTTVAAEDDDDDGITLNEKDAPTHQLLSNIGDIDGAYLCEGFAFAIQRNA